MQSLGTSQDQGRVLCVGLVCLDIVKLVKDYPLEDSAQRCLDCVWQRGGNASNTSSVLALLGQAVEYFGTVSQSQELNFLRDDFSSYGVHLDHVVVCPDTACPLSVVIVNTKTGSRTILHTNKNLRELTQEDFKTIPISTNAYKWIHFECRPTVSEIEQMLYHVLNHSKSVTGAQIITSLELEKPRSGCEPLFSLPDYLFLSKEFAQNYGCEDMEEAVTKFSSMVKPGLTKVVVGTSLWKRVPMGPVFNAMFALRLLATVICAWGEKGAAAKTTNSDIVISPAVKLDKVVDTLAAGDTFIAGTIFSLSRGDVSLRDAIEYGCKVAGTKCGMRGLKGLAKLNANQESL